MWYCLILHLPQKIIFHEINVVIIRLLSKVLVIIISSRKEQLLNSTAKSKSSLNLGNITVYKRLEVLFHLWNAGKKRLK